MYLKDLDVKAFAVWIESGGGRVLNPTNPFEVIRYNRGGLHVLYRKKTNKLTVSDEIWAHLSCFFSECPPKVEMKPRAPVEVSKDAKVDSPKKKRRRAMRPNARHRRGKVKKLFLRDGDCCALCSQFLEKDITLEHWIPVTAGGGNHITNLALMHRDCNSESGDMSLSEKIEFRDRVRAAVALLPPWDKFDIMTMRRDT